MRVTIKKLKIPEPFLKEFALLKKLEREQREILVQELEKITSDYIELSSDQIESISKISRIEQKDLRDLLDLILEIFFIQYSEEQETSVEEFLKKLEEGIKDTKDDKIIPADNEWEEYMSFWKSIFSMDKTIGLLAKANNIRKDYDYQYFDSKIYTEIRPIFSRHINTDLASTAILYHNLKIQYRQALFPEHFFISLNPEDLRDLKKVIDRALEKEKNLIKLFELKGLRLINKRE